jgi:hypothetical protein
MARTESAFSLGNSGQASLPNAWGLYLPEIWAKDRKQRKETGIPEEISFATNRRLHPSKLAKR